MKYIWTASLKETMKRIYYSIPLPCRHLLLPAKTGFKLISMIRPQLWIAKGKEVNSQEGFCIAYAGREIDKNYVMNLAYNGSFAMNCLGRVWLWRTGESVNRRISNCDLLVVSLDEPSWIWPKTRDGFAIPLWVASFTNFAGKDGVRCFSKDARYHIRKMLNNGFSFEPTKSRSDLREFYYSMYVPYSIARHGNMAIVFPYGEIKRELAKGELLLVKKDGHYVGGAVVTYDREYAQTKFLGVLDGRFELVRQGLGTAIYYFSLQYLRSKGYETVHLGASRPFLKDKTLQHKREWGGIRISLHRGLRGLLYLLPLRDTPGLRGFLVNNPFIFVDGEERTLKGAIFIDNGQRFSPDGLSRMYNQYYFDGLSELCIYNFGTDSSVWERLLPGELRKRMRFVSAHILFSGKRKRDK